MTDTTISPDTRPRHEWLSRREYEVFVRIAKGLSHAEIAKEFGLAFSTVSATIDRARKKTGLKSMAEIAVYAFKHGIGLK